MPNTVHLTAMLCLESRARVHAAWCSQPSLNKMKASTSTAHGAQVPIIVIDNDLHWRSAGNFTWWIEAYHDAYHQIFSKSRMAVLVVIVVFYMIIISTGKVMAQEEVWDNFYTACYKEMNFYCGTMAPQGSHLSQCLTDYRPALSPSCQQVITDLSSERTRAHIQMRCHADAVRLCPGLTLEDRRLADCMRTHIDQLSEGCKFAGPAYLIAAACRSDIAAFCQQGTHRDLALRICLLDHVSDLSPACIGAIPSPAKAERLSNYPL